MIIALAAQKHWKIFQMDVKSAFSNGVLEEEVYVEQPAGYIMEGKENECLYVDNLIFTGNSSEMINEFREDMMKEFEMTDLGLMSYFLGIEVQQTERGVFINQQRYLAATRPDIMYAVGLVSRFMESPRQSHLQAAKRILKYVKGTTSMGIFYTISEDPKLVGFTDSDWDGDTEGRRSTLGYGFQFGTGFFSWSSKKQQVVALSTTEDEYITARNCATQAVW
ncbi:uncharacterized protein LOC113324112 [Papaver somniferum]|uniref:uncharacterized protein LOC113324112 n=1 Tax=Papaver somniferum TaxID=3469 RepID=UPI000E6F9B3B|nr:uncharacterized protein LOC113324112 [Papaver somniferum]